MKKHAVYYNEINPQMALWLKELMKDGLIAKGEIDERSIEDIVPRELAEFTQCHFFAGIGVWSYALRCAGWPDDRPVWTGSCPCQPFSAAGKRAGFIDDKHLWPAFYHLIAVNRPDVVFGEQVASKDGLAWLDVVQSDLEAAAYDVGALDICAAGFGAPHVRQRLFFVAHSQRAKQQRAKRQEGRALGYSAASGFWANAEWVYCRDGKHRPAEPSIFPLADGTTSGLVRGGNQSVSLEAKSARLSGYGNAIVAPVATEFIRAYMGFRLEEDIENTPELGEHGGDHTSEQAKARLYNNLASRGTNPDYLTARLARDHKDIHEKLKAGEYKSVRAAAIDAGIVRELTPLEKAQKAWMKMTPEEQAIFKDWIFNLTH